MNDVVMGALILSLVLVKMFLGLGVLFYFVVEASSRRSSVPLEEEASNPFKVDDDHALTLYRRAIGSRPKNHRKNSTRQRTVDLESECRKLEDLAYASGLSDDNFGMEFAPVAKTPVFRDEFWEERPVYYHPPIKTEHIPKNTNNVFSLEKARAKRKSRLQRKR